MAFYFDDSEEFVCVCFIYDGRDKLSKTVIFRIKAWKQSVCSGRALSDKPLISVSYPETISWSINN